MRNKFFILLLAFAPFLACSDAESEKAAEEQKVKDSLANCKKPVFDEYKASELASLMRKMADEMNVLKTAITSEKGIPDSIALEYNSILTATPTDPNVKTDVFASMANSFLYQIGTLKTSDQTHLTEVYNQSISSCLVCHEQFCPGPIVKIKKLKI